MRAFEKIRGLVILDWYFSCGRVMKERNVKILLARRVNLEHIKRGVDAMYVTFLMS